MRRPVRPVIPRHSHRTINYLDAPAGAGKTHAILARIHQLVEEGEYVILCQPSMRLIDETEKRLMERFSNIHVQVIHGERTKAPVATIMRRLKQPYPDPHVLMITWEAFQRLKFIPNRSRWNLIIDEIPQAYDCFDENVPVTHPLVTQHVRHEPFGDGRYSLLWGENRREIRKIAENEEQDAALKVFQPLAARLASEHWTSYVQTASYMRLQGETGDSSLTKLTVYSFLRPSIFDGFRSVMIAGACFQDSILYRSFSKGDVVAFKEDEQAAGWLRFREHQNGETITFLYATEKLWSKRLRDSNGGETQSAIVEGVMQEFDGKDFIWSANKDVPDGAFGREMARRRLPQSPHGLNTFEHFDNVVFLSAHNLIPSHARFIQDRLRMDRDDLLRAIHRQHAYQAILRSSIRDPENRNEKKVFVPDRPTAVWLQVHFPGSQLRFLDCGLAQGVVTKVGRPREHESPAARMAKYRRQMAAAVEELNRRLFPNTEESDEQSDENASINSNFVTLNIHGSIFVNKWAKKAIHWLTDMSHRELEEFLAERSRIRIKDKESNLLICPSIFDPDKSGKTSRGKDNFVIASGIWLDFDGGELTPEKLAEIFPDVRMTIYATYNSTGERMRFRVYIPTDSLMTYDAYTGIARQIVNEIEAAGVVDKHGPGIDEGKLNPENIFYLPCQPKDPSGAYFATFSNKPRKLLNVEEWIEKLGPREQQTEGFVGYFAPRKRNQEKTNEAIEQWRDSQAQSGVGHKEFWRLACRLKFRRCEEHEIQSILTQEAEHARHPDQRRAEIPEIMKCLRKKAVY